MKTFTCETGEYNIDEVMNGQTDLIYQDTLGTAFSNPSLREDTILCYKHTGLEGITSQLNSFYSSESRTVKANPYWWTEKCEDDVIFFNFLPNPTPGATVQVHLDRSSHSKGGEFSRAMEGRRGYINELNQQVDILAVNKQINGDHIMTLGALNGRTLDLSQNAYYTIVVDPLRMYKKGDMECIPTEGYVGSLPFMRKGWIQKFEKAIEIHEDELDGYAYDREFKLGVGWDSKKQDFVENWDIPHISDKLMTDWMDSRNINTLVGERNDSKAQGFDGIITTADAQGMFTNYYDPNDGVSFKQRIMNMVKSVRKVNGCTDYLLGHDFFFGLDWSEQIASLVKDTATPHSYMLFGPGTEGARNFTWYEFKDFTIHGYNFRGYQIDAFDARRYGALLKNFAFVMPACEFTNTRGQLVPPIAFVNIERAMMAPVKKMWSKSYLEDGCRTIKVFIRDTYGMEIHCSSKMGTWRKETC